VALQGTIDTFASADVLRLLGSTAKTGRMILEGDRGRGEILLVEGTVKGLALGENGAFDEHPLDEAMFELLRFEVGDFVFDANESARDHQGEGWEVESLLASAGAMISEWGEIEQVVPSDRAWLSLTSELLATEVTIDAARWRLVAMIGSGLPVAVLADALGATELVRRDRSLGLRRGRRRRRRCADRLRSQRCQRCQRYRRDGNSADGRDRC